MSILICCMEIVLQFNLAHLILYFTKYCVVLELKLNLSDLGISKQPNILITMDFLK